MIIINFKNYKTSDDALHLAQTIEKYLPAAIIAVSGVDIGYLSYYTKLKVYAQHFDSAKGEKNTGFITSKAIKSQDAVGSLLNHSEHKLSLKEIEKSLKIAKKYNLRIVICAHSIKEIKQILNLYPRPYAIAFEDSKLISTI